MVRPINSRVKGAASAARERFENLGGWQKDVTVFFGIKINWGNFIPP